MLGVVIADDEKKICRLLEYLIDWKEIGVELLGVAYDGVSAYEMIQEKKPDILLTDISMPGMDGLELIKAAREVKPDLRCIIISGYKDFSYAQQGIWYGVKDYLLKPIDQEELTRSLKKLVQEAAEQKDKEVATVQMEETIKNYSEELKKVFLKTVLEIDIHKNLKNIIEAVNSKKAINIIEDKCRCLLVKPDVSYLRYDDEGYQMLLDKTIDIIRNEFEDTDAEMILETTREGIYALLFHDGLGKEEIQKAMNHIRERVIALRDMFESINVTVIFSRSVETPEKLINCILESRRAIYNRILTGTNKFIEVKTDVEEDRTYGKLNESLQELLESQSGASEIEKIEDCLEDAKRIVKFADGISGIDVMIGIQLMMDYFFVRLKKMDSTIDIDKKKEQYWKLYEHCISVDEAFALLKQVVCSSLHDVVESLKNREIKPIAYAKQYIDENKGKNIKLEELAKDVGFSYTYFSSLFKKETGQTITDYIQQVRIEAAKKLLVEKERSVGEVAGLVGYNDIKFFTKQFKKTVGVSPAEYHKMFLES